VVRRTHEIIVDPADVAADGKAAALTKAQDTAAHALGSGTAGSSRGRGSGRTCGHPGDGVHGVGRVYRIDIHDDGNARDGPGHGAADADGEELCAEPCIAGALRAGGPAAEPVLPDSGDFAVGVLPDAGMESPFGPII